MPLVLKGKSKARLEIFWDGDTPADIFIVSNVKRDISLYQDRLPQSGRINLELIQLDFFKLGDTSEIEIFALAQADGKEIASSESLPVQKCHHSNCGQWGHAREDGYCKHCGRRIRDQNYPPGFPKLEIGDFRIVLSNGVEGTLSKKKEIREYNDGVYSIGQYEDPFHARDTVEILEERFHPATGQRFARFIELLRQTELFDKQWKPPFSCFQEENQRAIWIYYPRFPKQSNWREISALSYVLNYDVEILSTKDIVKIGIQLCEIVKKIHQHHFIWGSLKLEDLILCRDKEKNVSIYLATRDIAWEGPISKQFLDSCLIPWELYWENSPDANLAEVTEVYVIAVLLYFLKAKAPNLLSYNSISYHYSLPSLKLFRSPHEEKAPFRDPCSDYFESTLNQALILDPQERGYRSVHEFQLALLQLLESPKSLLLKRSYVYDIGESLDVGNEKREDDLSNNQDAIFVSAYTIKKQRWGIFALCDGISTATVGSGDVASKIVINTFRNWWSVQSEKDRKSMCQYASTDLNAAYLFLNGMVNEANRKISQEVEKLASPEKLQDALIMGSTITVGIIYDGVMAFGWMGDSPVYRISSFGWERLNYEDNERNLRISKGMPLEECFIEGGNALTRCVGAHFYVEPSLSMHFGYTHLYPGEHIFICSDGIPDYIEQEAAYAHHENYQMLRISSILQEYEKDVLLDSKSLATIVISGVNRVGGGYDNLSAILISVLPDPAISYEKSYERLRSLSPVMQKLFKSQQIDWPI